MFRKYAEFDGRRWTELFWLLPPIAGVVALVIHLCEPSRPVATS